MKTATLVFLVLFSGSLLAQEAPKTPTSQPVTLERTLDLERENIKLKYQVLQLELKIVELTTAARNNDIKVQIEEFSKKVTATCPECVVDPNTLDVTKPESK